ncbi:hypothetical protein ACFQ1L_00325 [Phytohabitans flavus]|uniref:hypothetical protein n=1 Tax=Phytohabitans flavus TaxID=1076124 RepID=UPI0031EB0293
MAGAADGPVAAREVVTHGYRAHECGVTLWTAPEGHAGFGRLDGWVPRRRVDSPAAKAEVAA